MVLVVVVVMQEILDLQVEIQMLALGQHLTHLAHEAVVLVLLILAEAVEDVVVDLLAHIQAVLVDQEL